MSERYLKKVEILEQEFEFITSHEIIDEVTERAALYSLQICIESGMDIVAMKVKDLGLLVEDDSTNIDKLVQEQIIAKPEGALLKEFNGIRNAIAHKYNRLDTAAIKKYENGSLNSPILFLPLPANPCHARTPAVRTFTHAIVPLATILVGMD